MADYTTYELGNILKRLEKKVDAALCCCESLDMKNLGLGVPIYVGRFKNHLKIRSLVAGTNMNITYDSNTITFDSLAGGFSCSDLASCSTSNLPEGSNLYYTDARVLSYMTGQNISIFTNDSGYITSSALSGYVPTSRNLTINGTTYDLTANRTWSVGDILSSGSYADPTWITSLAYSKLTGAPTIPTVGTWGALNYPAWTTGIPFVKMTAAGTFALDTNTYLTSITSSDVTTALGYTPVTNARTLTINGTGYDLTADRTWTIPTFTTPLTTKGDIYVRNTTVDTRLPVGLDTQVLLADSSTTTGLKWGTNTAATPTGYYGAFQDLTNQTAAVINTGYPMLLGTTDLSNGVTVVSGSRVTIANTGIYNIQWSGQFTNPTAAEHDVTIWLRKNGVDVPGSSGIVLVPPKHGASDGHILPSWNFLLDVVAGDYYEFVWSTVNTSVYMSFTPAGSPPPSTASVVLTVTQQSGIMAGTGITAINSLTGAAQTMVAGTSGTDFAVSSVGTTHTLNLPTASATNRGALSTADWTAFNAKGNGTVTSVATAGLISGGAITSTGTITTSMATNKLVGRGTAGTGIMEEITLGTRLSLTATTLNVSQSAILNSMLASDTVGASTTTYYQPGSAQVDNTTENNRRYFLNNACSIGRLLVQTATTQNSGGSLIISINKGGVATGITVTIAASSVAGVFTDYVNTATAIAGDSLTIKAVNAAAANSAALVQVSFNIY